MSLYDMVRYKMYNFYIIKINMKNLKDFAKIIGLFVWGLIAVASGAGALNSMEGFYMFCGIANIAINGYCIYKIGKKIGL